MPLTVAKVKAIAADPAKGTKHPDSEGLYLFVSPTGVKSWRLDYSYAAKRKTLTIGRFPAISLADARSARDDAKALLAQGRDPMDVRKIERFAAVADATQNKWRIVAAEWRNKMEREGAAQITMDKHDWLIGLTLPKLGERVIGEIAAAELLVVLRSVERKGHNETARRLRSLMGRIFRYAISTGRAERDPAADLRDALTAVRVTHHPALFDPDKIGKMMNSIADYSGLESRWALLIAAHTFLRPGEVRRLEWADVDWAERRIVLPAERMKMKRKHIVPMSAGVVSLLKEARTVTGASRIVLPSYGKGNRPISENTMNNALKRLGYGTGIHVAHGFRRTASTILNENGWNPDWIEAQLAHQSGSVRAIYNTAQYLPDRARMMEWYSQWLGTVAMGIPISPPARGKIGHVS